MADDQPKELTIEEHLSAGSHLSAESSIVSSHAEGKQDFISIEEQKQRIRSEDAAHRRTLAAERQRVDLEELVKRNTQDRSAL